MIKNVYHNGKLIPAKDWDFNLKKPKVKMGKKAEVMPEPEPQAEVTVEVEAEVITE